MYRLLFYIYIDDTAMIMFVMKDFSTLLSVCFKFIKFSLSVCSDNSRLHKTCTGNKMEQWLHAVHYYFKFVICTTLPNFHQVSLNQEQKVLNYDIYLVSATRKSDTASL